MKMATFQMIIFFFFLITLVEGFPPPPPPEINCSVILTKEKCVISCHCIWCAFNTSIISSVVTPSINETLTGKCYDNATIECSGQWESGSTCTGLAMIFIIISIVILCCCAITLLLCLVYVCQVIYNTCRNSIEQGYFELELN